MNRPPACLEGGSSRKKVRAVVLVFVGSFSFPLDRKKEVKVRVIGGRLVDSKKLPTWTEVVPVKKILMERFSLLPFGNLSV